MAKKNSKTKKNFLGLEKVFTPKTDMAKVDFSAHKPKDIDNEKWILLQECLEKCPKWLTSMIKKKQVELIGICERVAYHKMHKDENVPYTHIFDHPSILLKHLDSSSLFIYSPTIVYVNKFIDG